jgi:hypothetical protein
MRPALICVLCLWIPTSLAAQDVSFTISTDAKTYTVRDPITVKYRIVNVSNGPLWVPCDIGKYR